MNEHIRKMEKKKDDCEDLPVDWKCHDATVVCEPKIDRSTRGSGWVSQWHHCTGLIRLDWMLSIRC
jgi:hypothetical protein